MRMEQNFLRIKLKDLYKVIPRLKATFLKRVKSENILYMTTPSYYYGYLKYFK